MAAASRRLGASSLRRMCETWTPAVAGGDFETALCWNMAVAPQVRASLAAREIDDDDVLRGLEVPLLVTQGRADTVVLPAMAEHILATCPTAEASWYEGVGHVPHLEEPERFNRELAALTRRVLG
jgi:non-heme chloroperoxidase